jgi:hypothetical protein
VGQIIVRLNTDFKQCLHTIETSYAEVLRPNINVRYSMCKDGFNLLSRTPGIHWGE